MFGTVEAEGDFFENGIPDQFPFTDRARATS